MAADYSRIHRLLKILTLIQGETGWTAPRLAVECGTTERSIYRDLKMLQGAGVPYHFDPESRGYVLGRDFFMPAVSLTLDESLALAALAERVGGDEQVPFTQAAARAISKVRCNLPPNVQRELQQIEQHVSIRLAPANPPEGMKDVYESIRAAIANRRSLECKYDSLASSRRARTSPADASEEVFLFKPYALIFHDRAWYALGHHGGRGEVRRLKLSRFSHCRPTDHAYEIPRSFSVAKQLGNAWRMIRGDASYDVELHFDADFAETIADTRWHQTQEIEWLDDDSILFRCTVDGLDEIVWWVLSMGPHCRVIRPRELIERVQELAGATARQYARRRPGQSKTKRAGRARR